MMQQKKPVLKKRSGFNSLVYRGPTADVQGAPVDPFQRRAAVGKQLGLTAKFTSIRRACRATEPGEPAGWPEQPEPLREPLQREPSHYRPEPGYRSRDCRSNDDDDDDHRNHHNHWRRRSHGSDVHRGNDDDDDRGNHSKPGHHRNPERHCKRNRRNRDQPLPSFRRPKGQYRQPRKRSRCPKLTCDSLRILLQGTGT